MIKRFSRPAILVTVLYLASALAAGFAHHEGEQGDLMDETQGTLSELEGAVEELGARTDDLESKDEEQDAAIEDARSN